MEVQNLLLVICFVGLGNSWSRHIINMIITLTPTEREELGYFSHPNKKRVSQKDNNEKAIVKLPCIGAR